MKCMKCKQPMSDPDDGIRRAYRTYRGRHCLDCIGESGAKPMSEMDTWEYINRRGIRYRLRDAASLTRGEYA